MRFEDIRAILKVWEGRDFSSRRDMAIIRFLLDSGLRRGELAGLRMEDVDLNAQTVAVTGSGMVSFMGEGKRYDEENN